MCELLWSDPQAEPGRSPSKRGVGVGFGEAYVAMQSFLCCSRGRPTCWFESCEVGVKVATRGSSIFCM